MALLLPLTYGLDPTAGMILFAGIYFGAMYGGVDHFDPAQHPGRGGFGHHGHRGVPDGAPRPAGAALAVAAIGSFVAGTISLVGLS